VLPPGSAASGYRGRLIVGIRPTDFEHSAPSDPSWPRLRIAPDVVEDLGSEHHVIFTLDAPRVAVDAVRAAADAGGEEGKLFADDRAVFTASLDDSQRVNGGGPLELALNPHRLHFFEPESGRRLTAAREPVAA
jgi:multiple sugar transport system ATP-binding protein